MNEFFNAFLNDIEFTKILGQFKQKEICKLIHDMQFQVSFLTFKIKIYKL
jgi:hypothetical protein